MHPPSFSSESESVNVLAIIVAVILMVLGVLIVVLIVLKCRKRGGFRFQATGDFDHSNSPVYHMLAEDKDKAEVGYEAGGGVPHNGTWRIMMGRS